jgi:hypothetical protein
MSPETSGLKALVEILKEPLKPVIREMVAEELAQIEADRAKVGDGRKAFFEADAAKLLGMTRFQLRGLRYNGRITASVVGPRNRPMYSQNDLEGFTERTPNEEVA